MLQVVVWIWMSWGACWLHPKRSPEWGHHALIQKDQRLGLAPLYLPNFHTTGEPHSEALYGVPLYYPHLL